MTETAIGRRAGIAARISMWVGRRQRELSARVHASGDERARRCGWTVIESTGRLGFGARSYRDPRFGERRQLSPGGVSVGKATPFPGQPRISSSAAATVTPSKAERAAGE
jgi:hypothetical protein